MATYRYQTIVFGALALAAVAAAAGCYKPHITDGGLLCADGRQCPDGFHCAATGLCESGPLPVCTTVRPHVVPICTADLGHDCDPICQSRCDCGRCNFTGTKLACGDVAAVAKQRGEICDPTKDDCVPGNICRRDCRGAIARCYRFCGNGDSTMDVCGDQQDCNVTVTDILDIATALKLCEHPAQPCNPVGTADDCGSPALACYVSSTGLTVCDCKGDGQPGTDCDGVFNSCIPGYRCVTANNTTTCRKTCKVGVAGDCPSGMCMSAGSGSFGYCQP